MSALDQARTVGGSTLAQARTYSRTSSSYLECSQVAHYFRIGVELGLPREVPVGERHQRNPFGVQDLLGHRAVIRDPTRSRQTYRSA